MLQYIKVLNRRFSKSIIRRATNLAQNKEDNGSFFCALQIIGSGAPGEPAAISLRTNKSSYLFNGGEGTIRLARNYLMNINDVSNIFITQANWSRIGGLSSIYHSIYQGSNTLPVLHGPTQLQKFMYRMIGLSNINKHFLTPQHYNSEDFFEDNAVRVDFARIYSTNSDQNDITVVYMCKLKTLKGKLNLNLCVEKGISVGPLFSEILKGNDVTLDDGTIVKHSDVVNKDIEASCFLVVDIPSRDYMRSLLENEQIANFIESNKNQMDVVAHLSSPNVIDTPEYRKFMEQTCAKRHIQLNENNRFSGLLAAHTLQKKLNELDSNIFPLLKSTLDFSTITDIAQNGNKSLPICDGAQTDMRLKEVSTSFIGIRGDYVCPKVHMDMESLNDLQNVHGDDSEIWNSRHRENTFPKITFFGTGSQLPGIYRNQTCILVETSNDTAIVLDCGEGSCGQMIRFFGAERAAEMFRKIKAVFVSHMHADHHMGLLSLLEYRKKLLPVNRPPLILISFAKQMKSWLFFYHNNIETIRHDLHIVDSENLMTTGLSPGRCRELDINSLHTCRVQHRGVAFGVSLRTNSTVTNNKSFKLTFSGDAMPSDDLVELGLNSTLLIHEATLEDALHESAKIKGHSTVSQAIKQGIRMNAEYTVLTHFSQRYLVPFLEENLTHNVGIAFDNMQIIESDLRKLSHFYPKMQEMFGNLFTQTKEKAIRNKVLKNFADEMKS